MNKTDAIVRALDGVELPASWWEVPAPRAVTIVSPATGTRRGFYRAFCEELARRGSAVVSYDYRGTFEPPAALRRSPARMRDWGTLDFPGVVDAVRARYPRLPVYTVGHSVGGHVLLMSDRNRAIDRAVLVASQSGYWRLYRGFESVRVYWFVKVVMPLLTRVFGYFPGKHIAFGTDLAPGVLYEWSRWCTSPGYFSDDPAMREVIGHARSFVAPTLMIGLSDDPWATPAAIDALQVWFTHANVRRLAIDPRAYGIAHVGHIDFFRARNAALWEQAISFLELDSNQEAVG